MTAKDLCFVMQKMLLTLEYKFDIIGRDIFFVSFLKKSLKILNQQIGTKNICTFITCC